MNNRIILYSLGLVLTLGFLVYQLVIAPMLRDQGKVLGRLHHSDGSYSVEVLSQPYRLDKVYKSMTGPRGNQPDIRLIEDAAADDILWLTGLEAEVVDADSLAPLSKEYFCHSNLTLSPSAI